MLERGSKAEANCGRVVRCALVVSLAVACSSSRDESPDSGGDDWAARIVDTTLFPSVVAAGLASDPNGERAVRNFVLATGLETSEPTLAAWYRRVALAHVLADELTAAAQAQGAVTDEELESWTSAHWLGVDRPLAFRTVHAVVVTDAAAGEAEQAASRALAEQIRSAVIGAGTVEEFRERVNAVPNSGRTVKVEDLEPVVADGRVVRLGARVGAAVATYDEAFARAATALEKVGETSPVVASSFGYHVLRLVELVPELRFGVEERRRMAARDVYSLRARRKLTEITSAAQTPVVGIERSAGEATARVSVE